MVDWDKIDTVFLDLDGTLLDLHFDNQFWLEHLPFRYAQRKGVDLEAAKAELYPRFRRVEGTMDWYCLDYWTRELGMDVALLKHELKHLIAVHPHVPGFLEAVRKYGKRNVLVTNAHFESLALKMEKTRLAGHFDAIICSHEIGLPKEELAFWKRLQERESFDPLRTLLVDDSLPVLRAAQRYGIAHLLSVANPDTRRPPREVDGFPAISSFYEIMPPQGAA